MIPANLDYALRDWVTLGRRPGDFLQACLRNDFVDAVCRADHINLPIIQDIAKYIYNDIPSPCWGSEEKMKAWEQGFKVV